jgi:hypothetical protein
MFKIFIILIVYYIFMVFISRYIIYIYCDFVISNVLRFFCYFTKHYLSLFQQQINVEFNLIFTLSRLRNFFLQDPSFNNFLNIIQGVSKFANSKFRALRCRGSLQ